MKKNIHTAKVNTVTSAKKKLSSDKNNKNYHKVRDHDNYTGK